MARQRRYEENGRQALPEQTIRINMKRQARVQRPPENRMPQRPMQTPPPQPPPVRRKKKRKLGCGCLTLPLFLLFFMAVTIGGLWAYEAMFGPPSLETLPQSQRQAVAQERATENVSFLMVGIDHRGDEPSRSDTMIFTVLRPVDNQVAMLSLPRDSLVDIPGYGMDKLNAAYSYGEMPLLTNTVQSLLSTKVNHFVVVDFQSFEKVIDAMGGITIDVPERMYMPEENIDLEAGKQRLNGADALAYVRWRGDGQGDLGRIERQQVFMQAVMKKAGRMMPWQAVRTAGVLHREVETDLSALEMIRLAYGMIGMRPNGVHSYQLQAEPQYLNDVSYVLLNESDIQETVELMRFGMPISGMAQNQY